MSNVKVFKRGETLFKEGDKATSVFLIQSGSVNLHLKRHKQQIDICTLASNQIAGEHALAGLLTHPHTAICMNETKAIELSIDDVKKQLEAPAVSQILRFLVKGLTDKSKIAMKELQSMKLEYDTTPCPLEQTAKIFGAVYHVCRVKGEAKPDGTVVVPWPLAKQYAQRVFLENPKRFEMATNVFVKLGVAKYEKAPNEDDPKAPEEIVRVIFSDLPLVEQFFEFFQYYYFKGGKLELLKTDDRVMHLTRILIDLGKAETPDRNGAVQVDFAKVGEMVKEEMGLQLNADHFSLLETKGLFVKRSSAGQNVTVGFDFKEFDRTMKVWKVLREVERWNEKGSVDPNEAVVEAKVKKAGPECSECHKPYQGTPKFCSECGAKITIAA
jgi:hypothetical protein